LCSNTISRAALRELSRQKSSPWHHAPSSMAATLSTFLQYVNRYASRMASRHLFPYCVNFAQLLPPATVPTADTNRFAGCGGLLYLKMDVGPLTVTPLPHTETRVTTDDTVTEHRSHEICHKQNTETKARPVARAPGAHCGLCPRRRPAPPPWCLRGASLALRTRPVTYTCYTLLYALSKV
jgi:hypothetical protein